MFDHLDIRVADLAASRRFYTEALGLPDVDGEWLEWGDFGIVTAERTDKVTRRLHVGFGVESRDAVDAWWNRMTEAGYRSDGEPGPRPVYAESYYGAFVRDPDGNSVEAVHHHTSRPGRIDHLWFRSDDVAAAKRFYESLAVPTGLRLVHDTADKARFTDGEGSFSFVAGDEPTRNVGLVFGVPDEATLEAFHRALPDPRDPDGNLVGAVVSATR